MGRTPLADIHCIILTSRGAPPSTITLDRLGGSAGVGPGSTGIQGRQCGAMMHRYPLLPAPMPIRWYGPANPADPTYRHFERIVNLTLHAALYSAINSGLWVVQELRHPWTHLSWFSLGWLMLLGMHAGVVLALRPGRLPEA